MSQIGDARTDRFFISPAEVRIGALSKAFRLLPDDSIGLLNSATVTFNIESVDLEAGLPRRLYDTQIVSQLGSVAMEMREYSRRNMQMLLGYAPDDYVAKTEATLSAPAVQDTDNSITLQAGEGSKFAQGNIIAICSADLTKQAQVTYAEVTSVTVDTLSLSQTVMFNYATNDKVFNAEPIPIGANTTTQYFTAQVLGTARDNNPVGFIFWKCALSSGLEVGFQGDDFNTNSGELKILAPSAADLAVGGPLNHVAAQIANHPNGMALYGGDLAA